MGGILAVVSFAGYILALTGFDNQFVYKIAHYPYIGTVYRLCGPTFTPTMIATLLICALFFSVANYKEIFLSSSIRKVVIALMIIACILTFSKSILVLGWGLTIILLKKNSVLSRRFLIGSIAVTTFLLILTTHFLLIKSEDNKIFQKTPFTSGKIFFSTADYDVIETTYLTLKRTAIKAFGENPLFGIGSGNFNNYIDFQKQKGRFPLNIPEYDPHSTYVGALAETGLVGFCLLLLLWFLLIKNYCKIKSLKEDPFYLSIFLVLSFFMLEGISTDIMNFRHLWVIMAIAFVYHFKTEPAIK